MNRWLRTALLTLGLGMPAWAPGCTLFIEDPGASDHPCRSTADCRTDQDLYCIGNRCTGYFHACTPQNSQACEAYFGPDAFCHEQTTGANYCDYDIYAWKRWDCVPPVGQDSDPCVPRFDYCGTLAGENFCFSSCGSHSDCASDGECVIYTSSDNICVESNHTGGLGTLCDRSCSHPLQCVPWESGSAEGFCSVGCTSDTECQNGSFGVVAPSLVCCDAFRMGSDLCSLPIWCQ